MAEFEQQCKQAARQLRRLPAELRRQLGPEVRDEVAEPLAGSIRAAFSGPWVSVLAAAVKTRIRTDPTIVVGGSRSVLSGGGSVRSIVFGNEFGGGTRVTPVPSRAGRRGYRRRSTRQFAGAGRHPIFGTIERKLDDTFERWTRVVERITDRTIDSGR